MKKVSSNSKIFRNIMFLVNLFFAAWLVGCIYTAYLDTSTTPSYLVLLTYTTPFGLLANLFFVLFWFLLTKRWKWFSLLSLSCLLISYPISKNIFGIHLFGSDQIETKKTKIKVMTYNVHLFDLGEWTKDKSTERKILELLKEEAPDILCFQEYYTSKDDIKLPMTELITDLGYPYYYFVPMREFAKSRITISSTKGERLGVGLMIFSKYELKNRQEYSLSENQAYKLATAQIDIDTNKTIQIAVTHLQSFSLGASDRVLINKTKKGTGVSNLNKAQSVGIINKIKSASQKRAEQANSIATALKNSSLPTILCGDLNDVPGSYVYQTVKGDREDVFSKRGFGLGRTFRDLSPTLRIDHMFYSPLFFKPISYRILQVSYSDHMPVVAEFEWNDDHQ